MRRILIALAILAFCSPAYATWGGNDTSYDNRSYDNRDYDNSVSNTAKGGNATGGNGTGVGIGIGGKGGSSSNRLSNSQGQSSRNTNTQGLVGINGQTLEGVGAGNVTELSVGGDDYEASNIPPMAPSVTPPPPTAPCIVTFGGSAGTAAISFGATGFTRDTVCTWGEVARAATNASQPGAAAYALGQMIVEAERVTGTAEYVREQQSAREDNRDPAFSALDAISGE